VIEDKHKYEKAPVYEYGVGFNGEEHRTGMTYFESLDWVKDWHEHCRNHGGNSDAFYMIRRPIGEWNRFA